ncbi:uncharacterized protein Dana_GF27904 [Drosophila ananassae]|uniref:Uncharacterized protein n=1 Tax=Drosophila ananassae TaxID=7217 RepID=A0A0N8P1C4_DROAN|nr:uncharacterized protein Dana_GF27904 [Drosophila ananassae]
MSIYLPIIIRSLSRIPQTINT